MKILTVEEVSNLLKVKPPTIYSWVQKGKIPVIRIEGVIRFNSDSIEKWLKEMENNVTAGREGKQSIFKSVCCFM